MRKEVREEEEEEEEGMCLWLGGVGLKDFKEEEEEGAGEEETEGK